MNAMSTPTRFSQEVFDTICERIIEGESLRAICRDPDMPSASVFCRWLAQDETGELVQQYARAREIQADTLADEIIDIADNARNDWMEKNGENSEGWQLNGEHVQRSRIRIDARKWYAGKLRPQKYGDKVLNETDITMRRIERVETVILPPPERDVIDVTPVEDEE